MLPVYEDWRRAALEYARAGVTLGGLRTHLDVVVPYFLGLADAEQRDRWFPGPASGELCTAIAMSEPGTGSYLLDGAKTFITGGHHADLVIVVARTATDPDDRRAGLSLLVVEKGTPGFTVGRRLEKIGLPVQDTAELSFDRRPGPRRRPPGRGGRRLHPPRPQPDPGRDRHRRRRRRPDPRRDRADRRVRPRPYGLRPMFLDAAVEALVAGELSPGDAAKTKLFCTETQGRVVDRCLQLHGGYGYILESPIARLYADARVTRIYGGTSEVLKTILSKSLGL